MRTFLWGKAGLAAHILPAEQSPSQADPHDSQEQPRAGLFGLGSGVAVSIQQASQGHCRPVRCAEFHRQDLCP